MLHGYIVNNNFLRTNNQFFQCGILHVQKKNYIYCIWFEYSQENVIFGEKINPESKVKAKEVYANLNMVKSFLVALMNHYGSPVAE